MRVALRAILVFLGILVLAAVVIVLNAGRLVKQAVEREATASLRLTTTLDRATVSLLGGRLGLHGLAIASPHGFSAPHMLEAGDIDVSVRYRELKRQPIHVGSITIDKPTLVIEQSGGALNFRKAMQLMPQPPPGKQPMKLVIDDLKLTNGRVVIRPGLPGLAQEITVSVPNLAIKDIGRGRGAHNGAAVKDVAMTVITALAGAAAESEAVPVQVRAVLKLGGALQNPASLLKDPDSLLKGLGEAAGKSAPRLPR